MNQSTRPQYTAPKAHALRMAERRVRYLRERLDRQRLQVSSGQQTYRLLEQELAQAEHELEQAQK